MFYRTEYRAGHGGFWPAQIRARSWPQAEELAKRRGLAEVIDRAEGRPIILPLPSRVAASHRASVVAKFHALSWLGLLALSSRVATPRDFFDDETGVLHVLAHLLGGAGYSQRERRALRAEMLERIRRIERRVPGGV